MGSEKWDNRTFPSSIPARKSAEVVWLPIGSLGTLVVIGGALNHELMNYGANVTDEQRTMGKYFVDNVHLYDIANDKWYTQQTSGDNPPATSEFCTSYAASQDGKSFQVSFDSSISPSDRGRRFSLEPSLIWRAVSTTGSLLE